MNNQCLTVKEVWYIGISFKSVTSYTLSTWESCHFQRRQKCLLGNDTCSLSNRLAWAVWGLSNCLHAWHNFLSPTFLLYTKGIKGTFFRWNSLHQVTMIFKLCNHLFLVFFWHFSIIKLRNWLRRFCSQLIDQRVGELNLVRFLLVTFKLR